MEGKYFSSRILKYSCLACKKIFLIRVFDMYEIGNELEMILSASGKRFILRDKKDLIKYAVPII